MKLTEKDIQLENLKAKRLARANVADYPKFVSHQKKVKL
jgi:hypothetical protein